MIQAPYPAGYLAYGQLSHETERDYICDMCATPNRGGINAKTCPKCKATPAYRERKAKYQRNYLRRRKAVLAAVLLVLLALAGCAPKRYRVCWQGQYTGDQYCGQPMPRKVAEAWAAHENAKYPGIAHRVKKVKR